MVLPLNRPPTNGPTAPSTPTGPPGPGPWPTKESLFIRAEELLEQGLSEEEVVRRLLKEDGHRDEDHVRKLVQAAAEIRRRRGGADSPGVDMADLAARGGPQELESLPLLGRLGYIIKGWGHILAGLPKVGKTELLFACVREWLPAGVKVLWLSEEDEQLWLQRLARYPNIPRGGRVVFGRGCPPPELLALAKASGADVVIVDTIRTMLQIPDENDNSAVVRALDPWEVALKDKTRIYVHHLRKSGGDHGLGVAGAGSLVGSVHRILELHYDADPNRRRLTVLSRLRGAPELLCGWRDGELKALGSPAAVALEDVKERVLEALEEAEWLTFKELLEALPDPKPGKNLVRAVLKWAHERGLVERDPPEDRPGALYRWRLAPNGKPYLAL